eukprot:jgi/Undpi1/10159/HiC_scaffold_28.g12612.m1
MGLRPASFVTALLTLPTRGSGYVFPSVWCRGYSAHQPSPPAAPHTSCIADTSGRAPTGVRLRRDEIPEENARQIEAADRRVKELEEEYWKSLDAREVAIERKCSSGLACLKMGLLERAAEDYAAANELSEKASRAWPLGLVLFYLDRYHEAANSLDTDISLFEAKFEESATDERIWQAAAIIRAAQQAGGNVANIVAGLRPLDIAEPDVLRRTVYDLFRGTASPEDVVKLSTLEKGSVDYLGMQFFSQVFLGLWHDVHGNEAEAKRYIIAACSNTYPKPDDLWYFTPRIHAKARKWT